MIANMTFRISAPLYPLVTLNLLPYHIINPKVEKYNNDSKPMPKPWTAPSFTAPLYAFFVRLLYRAIAFFSPLKETTCY